MDWSGVWEASGVVLTAIVAAIGVARHEVKTIVVEEIAKHEEHEKENMKPIMESVCRNEKRMDSIQEDIAYIRGYLDREMVRTKRFAAGGTPRPGEDC